MELVLLTVSFSCMIWGIYNYSELQKLEFKSEKTFMEIAKELETLKDYSFSIVFYESPVRIKDTLKEMYRVFGNRKCVILREITKLYEETIDLELSEYNELYDDLT